MSTVAEATNMQPVLAGNTYQTFHNGNELDNGDDSEDDLATGGDGRIGIDKRKLYEPEGWTKRARRVVFSPRGACYFAVGIFLCILLVAVIAAFARPYTFCSCPLTPNKTVVASSISTYGNGSSTGPLTAVNVSPPTTDDGKIFPWDNIRLPSDVVPSSYDLRIHPNLTTFRHQGSGNITFRVTSPTKFLVLHSRSLNLTDVHLLDSTAVEVKKVLVYKQRDQIYVEFSKKLDAGKDHVLSIRWTGELLETLNGFYISSYRTAAGEKRALATTHFEPTYARMAFPCFDEPALKATFLISVVRDSDHISLSNMPKRLTSETEDGLFVDYYNESLRMSTYLVAFIVCDFANVTTTTKDGVRVSVFAQADLINQTAFALEVAKKALEYLNEFFGIPYPLPKQDLVAIPDFGAGAMENWGLTTYREEYILMDDNETSLSSQQAVLTTISHELAHQWFGDLVTMKWWNDIWLNEGFATFMENNVADQIRPTWRMMDQFILGKMHPALQQDSLVSSHPISVEVHDPLEIESIFDDISYKKGASIMHMLGSFLGNSTLTKGLHSYLDAFNYSNAQTNDLWQVLSQESSKMNVSVNVSEVMDTWTQQMGFPLITISRKGDEILANQQRFLIGNNGTADALNPEFVSKYGYKWHVPLTCITNEDHENIFLIWMNLSDVTFKIDSGVKWIKCNVGQNGFYRVTYEEEMWRALVAALKANHSQFSAADRASLLDDAFTLSRNNQLNSTIPLEMTEYLTNETEYGPLAVALRHLNNIRNNLDEKPCFIYLNKYIIKLIGSIVKNLGWDDTGTHMQRMLRPLVLLQSAESGNKEVINKAIELFHDWKTNGKRISSQLRAVVYSMGIRHGNYSDWQFCWELYQKTLILNEKATLGKALGSSADHWILSQLLNFSLQNDKIRQQHTESILFHVANNPIGRDMTWRFVRTHWKKIAQLFGTGSFTISNIINDVSRRFTTSFDYDEVKTFFSTADVGSGKRAVRKNLEKISNNMAWLEHNEAVVDAWLRKQFA